MFDFLMANVYWMLGLVVLTLAVLYVISCFTLVKEGTSKQVMRGGAYLRTLFQKRDCVLDENGTFRELSEEEKDSPENWLRRKIGGLRWVSLLFPWGMDKIYTRTMKFVKALSNGVFEPRADENTDFILTGVPYQYGLEFFSMEDSENVPLSGKMTLTAMIVNPYKALFGVANWFDALVGRILPQVREYISNHAYNQIISDPGSRLDEAVFRSLNNQDRTDPRGRSIHRILEEDYGIKIIALEMVNIDPPPENRETTVAKWRAVQEAEADLARQGIEAEAFAAQTSGREIAMISRWTGVSVDKLQKQVRKAMKDDQEHGLENWLKKYPMVSKNWAVIQQQQLGVKPQLFGTADGTAMDPIMGALLTLIGAAKGGGQTSPPSGGQAPPTSGDQGGGGDRRSSRRRGQDNFEDDFDDDFDATQGN